MDPKAVASLKYRLYPTAEQARALVARLEVCREFYNAALEERREAWRRGVSISYYDQQAQVPAIRAERPELRIVSAHLARDPLRRLDRAFKAFYRRCRAGEKVGYPRFRAAARYDSFTHTEGVRLAGARLVLTGVGAVRMRLSRPVVGAIREVTVKREGAHWAAILTVRFAPEALPPSPLAVGLDLGLNSYAVLSDGSDIANPRYFRAAQRRLRVAGRRVARRKLGSHRRRKAAAQLRAVHARIGRQRADHQHKVSREIVNGYGLIAVENLNVRGLARTRLAKSIHDAGWSQFIQKLTYKAEWAGRELIQVDARGTSQTCLCGAAVPKKLSDRWHDCPECGLSEPRDLVSAKLILSRGLRDQASTWEVAPCVA